MFQNYPPDLKNNSGTPHLGTVFSLKLSFETSLKLISTKNQSLPNCEKSNEIT